MGIVGIIAIFTIFFSFLAVTVTGRKQWLVICIWCAPVAAMTYIAPHNGVINGLIILICMFMSLEVGYSVWGVKLWCIQTRKKNVLLFAIVYIINFFLTFYCFQQSLQLGYFGEISVDDKLSIVIIALMCAILMAGIMQNITISALEKYFSKKEEFPLIHCEPVKKTKDKKIEMYRRYAIKGTQNGKTYVFNMTRKAYLVLKTQKSFVFDARRGILGGVYVKGGVYDKDTRRRVKRANRILLNRAVFSLFAIILLLLLIVRIKTGNSFDVIFAQIGRGLGLG